MLYCYTSICEAYRQARRARFFSEKELALNFLEHQQGLTNRIMRMARPTVATRIPRERSTLLERRVSRQSATRRSTRSAAFTG